MSCNCDASQQLTTLQAKFDSWQSKAKVAMDKQRTQNKELEQEVARLRASSNSSSSAISSSGAPAGSEGTAAYAARYLSASAELREAERRSRLCEAALMSRLEVVATYFNARPFIGSSLKPVGISGGGGGGSSSAGHPNSPAAPSPTTATESDKQRSRSERALLQANAVNVELTEKVADLQDSFRVATADRDKMRERLEIKDNTIRALESQLVEATFAIQQASSRAERAEDEQKKRSGGVGGASRGSPHHPISSSMSSSQSRSSTGGIGTSADEMMRVRGGGTGSINNNSSGGGANPDHQLIVEENSLLNEQLDASHSTVTDLRLQVDHLNLVLQRERSQRLQGGASSSHGGGGGSSGIATMSESERDEILSEIDHMRSTNQDLRAKVSALEMRCANDSTSTSTIAALRQQLATKTRQVLELQELVAASQSSSPAGGGLANSSNSNNGGGAGMNGHSSSAGMGTESSSGGGAEPSSASASGSGIGVGGGRLPSSNNPSYHRGGSGGGGAAHAGPAVDPHMAHLRSTILQLLVSDRDDVKSHLIPVVSALLQLPQCDVRSVYAAHPEWMPQQR